MRPNVRRPGENWLRSILRATWAVCIQIVWGIRLIFHTAFFYFCYIQRYNPVFTILERQGRLSAVDCYGAQLYRPSFYGQLCDIFASDQQLKRKLLKWLANILPQYDITNFHNCWNDGIALCALLEAICPGVCPHYNFLQNHCRVNNCRLALRLANQYFNIPNSIITAEEIAIADEFNGADNIYRLVHTVKLAAEYLQYRPTSKESRSNEMLTTLSHRACVVSGKGISHGTVGRKAEFTVSLPKKYPLYLKINILAPTTRPSETSSQQECVRMGTVITDLQDSLHYGTNKLKSSNSKDSDESIGTYSAFEMLPFDYNILPDGKALVSYMPRNSGFHYVRVRIREQDVDGSPFRVLITHPTLTYQDSRSTFKRSFSLDPSWTVIDNDKRITVRKKRILRRTLIPRILKDGQNNSESSNEWPYREFSEELDQHLLNTSPTVSLALKYFQDGIQKRSRPSSLAFKTYEEELDDDDVAINFRRTKSLKSQDLPKTKEASISNLLSDCNKSGHPQLTDCRFNHLKVDTNSESNLEYLTPGSSPCPLISEDDNSSGVYFDTFFRSGCENEEVAAGDRCFRRRGRRVENTRRGLSKIKADNGEYVSVYTNNVKGNEIPHKELSGKEENDNEEEEEDEEEEEEEEEEDYKEQEEEEEYENREAGEGGRETEEDDDEDDEDDEEEDEEEEEEEDDDDDDDDEGEEENEEEDEEEEEQEDEKERESENNSKVKKRSACISRRVTAPLQCQLERIPKSILKNGLKSKRSAFSSVKRSSPKLTSPNTSDVSHDSFSDELFLSYPLAMRHKDSMIKNKQCFSSLCLKRSSSIGCEGHSPVHRPQPRRRFLDHKQISYDEFVQTRRHKEHDSQKKRHENRNKAKFLGEQTCRPKSPISTQFRSEDSDSSSVSIPRNTYKSNEQLSFSNRYCTAAPSGRVTPCVLKKQKIEAFKSNRPTVEHSGETYGDSGTDISSYQENRFYNIGFEEYNQITFDNGTYAPEDNLQCTSTNRQQPTDSYETSHNPWERDIHLDDGYHNQSGMSADPSFPNWRNRQIQCGPIRNRSGRCSCQKKESSWIPVSNNDLLKLRVCQQCHNSVGRPTEMSPTSSMSPPSDINASLPLIFPRYQTYSREDLAASSPSETTRSEGTETYKSEIQILIKSPRCDKRVQTVHGGRKAENAARKKNSVTVKKSKLLVLHNYALPGDQRKCAASDKGARTSRGMHNASTGQPCLPAIVLNTNEKEARSVQVAARNSERPRRGDNLENQRFVHSWLNDYTEELPPRQSTMETIDSGIVIDSRSSSPQRPATLGGHDPPSSMPRSQHGPRPSINAESADVSNRVPRQQLLQAHYGQLEEYTEQLLQRQRIHQLQKQQTYILPAQNRNRPEGRNESPPCTRQPVSYRRASDSSESRYGFVPHLRHSASKSLIYAGCPYNSQSTPTDQGCSYGMPPSSPVSSSNWTQNQVKVRSYPPPRVRQFGNGGLLQAIIKPYEETSAQKRPEDSHDETSEMEFWSSGGYHEAAKTDEDSQFLSASYGGRDSSRTTASDNICKSNVSMNKNKMAKKKNDSEIDKDFSGRRRYYSEQIDSHNRHYNYYPQALSESRPHYSTANSLFTEASTSSPIQFNSSPAQLTTDIYVPEHIKYNSGSPNNFSRDSLFYCARPGDRFLQRANHRQQPLGLRSSMRQYQSYACGLNELPLTDTDEGFQRQASAPSSLSSDKNLYAQYYDRSDATDFSSLMEMEELPSTSEAALNEVHGYRSDNPENLSPAGSLLINEINYDDEEGAPWCNRHPDYLTKANVAPTSFETRKNMPSPASDHRDYYPAQLMDKPFRPNVNPCQAADTCYSECREICEAPMCLDQYDQPLISNNSLTSNDDPVPGMEMLFYTLHRAIANIEERPHNECYALGPGLDNGYVRTTNFFQKFKQKDDRKVQRPERCDKDNKDEETGPNESMNSNDNT